MAALRGGRLFAAGVGRLASTGYSVSVIAFCGLSFPDGQPQLLLPDGMRGEATSTISYPTLNSDAMLTLHFLGNAYDFARADFAVPYSGQLSIDADGEDAPCQVINVHGQVRPARVFVYRDHTAARETWLGLVVFEEDEPAMNLARNSRDLRMPPRTEVPEPAAANHLN